MDKAAVKTRLESKECDSSKSKRSNIPIANSNCKQNAGKGFFQKGVEFPRHNSKPKQLKMAIVKPFNFAAITKELAEAEVKNLDPEVKNSRIHSDLNEVIPNVELFKPGESKDAKPSINDPTSDNSLSVIPTKYEAHSGIAFLGTPKKCTVPKPFNIGVRRKTSFQMPKPEQSSKSNPVADTAVRVRSLRRQVSCIEVKSNAEKRRKQVQESLADVKRTVLEEAPVVMKNFPGHSGIPFKARQLSKPSTNPFANGVLPGNNSQQNGTTKKVLKLRPK